MQKQQDEGAKSQGIQALLTMKKSFSKQYHRKHPGGPQHRQRKTANPGIAP